MAEDNNLELENDNEFDAGQGHGSHLECIDEDINYVVETHLNTMGRSMSVVGQSCVTTKTEGEDCTRQLILLSTSEERDMTMRTILEENEDGAELLSCFPYVVNNKPLPMVLARIDEYANGFEAVLTCKYADTEFRFFDMDYPLHKAEYVIGNTYDFALSAIAYKAEKVPEDEMALEIEPETVEKMHEADPSIVDRDAQGNALPMKLFMNEFATCLQRDGRYPDDGEFWSPIRSKVRKANLLKRDFYFMEITIYQDVEIEHVVNIPLAARTSFFDEKPAKGTSIRGYLWLQGRICTPATE